MVKVCLITSIHLRVRKAEQGRLSKYFKIIDDLEIFVYLLLPSFIWGEAFSDFNYFIVITFNIFTIGVIYFFPLYVPLEITPQLDSSTSLSSASHYLTFAS